MSLAERVAVVMGSAERLRDLTARGLRAVGVGSVVCTEVTDKFEGDLVVLTGCVPRHTAERIDALCRSHRTPFVWVGASASSGFVFDDFGESHTVHSEACSNRMFVVTGITQDKAGGIVSVDESDDVSEGVRAAHTRVVFTGMTNDSLGSVLESKSEGHLVVDVISEHAFRIETDTSRMPPFSGCGYATCVSVPSAINFVSLADSLCNNDAALSAISSAEESRSFSGEVAMCGIACSEAVKALTGVLVPVSGQWVLQTFQATPSPVLLADKKIFVAHSEPAGHTSEALTDIIVGLGASKCNVTLYHAKSERGGDGFSSSDVEQADLCIAICLSVSLLKQLADLCVIYERPLFVASVYGYNGEVQSVIPHKTAAFDPTRHQTKQADYPECVLQNFPYRPEHVLSWARSKLGNIITTTGTNVVSPSALFNELFESGIEGLLTSSDASLWTGLKRRPRPLKCDRDAPVHSAFLGAVENINKGNHSEKVCLEFVNAAVQLRAENYGITMPPTERNADQSSQTWPTVTTLLGLLCVELTKLFNPDARNDCFDASVDLKKNVHLISTFPSNPPAPVEPGSPWTVWDSAKVVGNEMTLGELAKALKKRYHGTVSAVIYNGRTIFVSKKNRKTGIMEALGVVAAIECNPNKGSSFVAFDVIAEDSDGNDVDIPKVKYYFK